MNRFWHSFQRALRAGLLGCGIWLGWFGASLAQIAAPTTNAPASDTVTLKLEAFLARVASFHPVAAQADLFSPMARARLMEARGSFDPKLKGDWEAKVADDKLYYNSGKAMLDVPVWPGFNLKGGWERGVGEFISSERVTSTDGLLFAGIAVPIGGDLVMDWRRNMVRQAQLLPELAEAERDKVLLKLMWAAAKTFTDWQAAYETVLVRRLGVDFANERYAATVQRYRVGDLAAVDTLEAFQELLGRRTDLAAAELALTNHQYLLAAYFWNADGLPVNLPPAVRPEAFPDVLLTTETDSLGYWLQLVATHPELRALEIKQEQLRYEERFRTWALLPSAQLEYTPLLKPGANVDPSTHFTENYKWGGRVEIPLFLRKERGKLQQVQLKRQELGLDQELATRELSLQVEQLYIAFRQSANLALLQQQAVVTAQAMRDAEVIKFRAGESTLFILNARERKLLDDRAKAISLNAKALKDRIAIQWAAGGLLPGEPLR